MKQYIILAVFAALSLSFFLSKNNLPDRTVGLSVCRGDRYEIDFQRAELFEHWKYRLAQKVVRRNIAKMTEKDSAVILYKLAIETMRKRKPTDPTSFEFQAAMHGSKLRADKNEWDQCQHGNDFFLSWHRMYLYFFERICRKACGNERFALPFWDYSSKEGRQIPVVFRKPAIDGNALWTKSRDPDMNGGAWLTDSEVSTKAAFKSKKLVGPYSFQDFLEDTPHGTVHMAAAGSTSRLMGSFATAGLDPLFWVHHCNIDRLWVKYMNETGAAMPTGNDKWMNKEFLFYDENGKPVRMTGKQVMDIAEQLDYSYEGLTAPKPPQNGPKTAENPADSLVRTVVSVAEKAKVKGNGGGIDMKETNNKPPVGRRSPGQPPKGYLLVLKEIEIGKLDGEGYEIYLNLPKGTAPDPSSDHFCGMLNLFALESKEEQRLPVTEIVQKLQSKGIDTGEARVTLYQRKRELPEGKRARAAEEEQGRNPGRRAGRAGLKIKKSVENLIFMHLSDILTHLGEERETTSGPSRPPVVQTSNFVFKDLAAFRAAFADEFSNHVYSRGNNPTTEILRKKIAALEGTEDALVFASGAAAIAMAVIGNVKAGDHVVCQKSPYSWTNALLTKFLPRFGVEATFVDGTDIENIRAALRPNTTVLFLESPNTMTFECQDLAACAELARSRGIVTMIDNSFASPLFQNPAKFGIDITIHTGTKWLNGHSDVVFGALCASRPMVEKIFHSELMTLGGILAPHDAALAIRGLRTLELRVKRSAETAEKLVNWLAAHPKVERVLWPFHESFPQKELAKKQMSGCGGLFSVVFKTESKERMANFIHRIERFLMAVSWGGHESLMIPTLGFYDIPGKAQPSLPWTFVRFYVGLEDADWLMEDLERAMEEL